MSCSTARVILGQVLSSATCGTRTHRGDSLWLDTQLANPLGYWGPLTRIWRLAIWVNGNKERHQIKALKGVETPSRDLRIVRQWSVARKQTHLISPCSFSPGVTVFSVPFLYLAPQWRNVTTWWRIPPSFLVFFLKKRRISPTQWVTRL